MRSRVCATSCRFSATGVAGRGTFETGLGAPRCPPRGFDQRGAEVMQTLARRPVRRGRQANRSDGSAAVVEDRGSHADDAGHVLLEFERIAPRIDEVEVGGDGCSGQLRGTNDVRNCATRAENSIIDVAECR
jgi:hypothetical protein